MALVRENPADEQNILTPVVQKTQMRRAPGVGLVPGLPLDGHGHHAHVLETQLAQIAGVVLRIRQANLEVVRELP